MDIDKAIKTRHSVRHFKTTKHVDWRDVIKAIDSARLAPLAGNISTLKFILVTDPQKIARLAEASQQRFIKQADYVVVVCSSAKRIKRGYEERSQRYVKQQAGAAIENFLLKITDLGLATCWVGAFDDETVKSILGIPDINAEVEALLPIGNEAPPKTEQKSKPELDHILYFNQWGKKHLKPLRKPEAI